jgi:hypothetical protein
VTVPVAGGDASGGSISKGAIAGRHGCNFPVKFAAKLWHDPGAKREQAQDILRGQWNVERIQSIYRQGQCG